MFYLSFPNDLLRRISRKNNLAGTKNMREKNNPKVWQIWSSLILICLTGVFAIAGNINFDDSFKQWNTIGPSGGDVRVIKINPQNNSQLFVTTLDGQIYTSYDEGKNWQLLVNFNRPQLILDNFIIDSRDSNVLYVAGHRHKRPGGFFKSIDGGKTWKESKQLKNEAIHALVQSSKNPDMILAGSVTGVWISRDSGETWEKNSSESSPQKLGSFAIDPRDTDTMYAGTWYRAYKSTDGGKNWKLVKKGMIDDSDVFAIDIDPKNPDSVIAAACSGIYLSRDKGESWKKVQGIPSQARRTRDIIHHPTKPNYVYAGTTEGFWMSTNGGVTWRLTSSKNIEINSIAVHPDNPNKVYIGTNNYGVMVSNDFGRSFGLNNGNFTSRFTYNIVADSRRPSRMYATTINTAKGGGYIFISEDFGNTWRPSVKNIDTNRTTIFDLVQDKVDPEKIYLATNYGIFQSLDRGENWTLLKTPKVKKKKRRRSRRSRRARKQVAEQPKTVEAPQNPGFVKNIETRVTVLKHTEDGKNGYIAATNKGLFRSYDISKGWQKIDLGERMDNQISAIHVSTEKPEVIWVGTAAAGLHKSEDGGKTWSVMDTIPTDIPISAINSNPYDPNIVFVGTIQTLYMSKDLGKTWVRRGGNLPLGNFHSILINPKDPNEMYVASARENNGGIFISEDAGWSWKRIDSSKYKLASNRIWSLAFNPINPNELYAGTHSSGIYRIKRSPVAKKVIDKKKEKPKGKIIVEDVSGKN